MIEKRVIEDIVNESIKDSGIFLVDVQVSRTNVIRVFIDHHDGIGLDDCIRVHRMVEGRLDRDREDFELQVSSPGLGEPFRVIQQYSKAAGKKLILVLEEGETVRGTLEEVRNLSDPGKEELLFRLAGTKRKAAPEEPVLIPVAGIQSAREEIDFKMV